MPTNLRQCADQYRFTDPATMKTRADLMIGYGDERSAHTGVSACLEELVRLADEHNKQMRQIGKP